MASTGTLQHRRAGLDVLRTVAIALVLLQHLLVPQIPLGRTGVSLFFALSGYLITGLLMQELDTHGRLRLSSFYVRRFARLMPALAVMVATCTVFLASVGMAASWWHVGAALTYTENIEEVVTNRSDPFFGHTWSLAVEEHFYLLWPVVLLALHRRLTVRRVLATILAFCAVDLAVRGVLLAVGDASDTFFYEATPARFDALLLGCAACLAVRLGWRPGWVALVAGAGLLGLQLAGPDVLRGPLLMSTVSGVASALLVAAGDLVSRAASRSSWCRTFRAGADLSYPLYLWHSPVIVVALLGAQEDTVAVRLTAVCVATGLAYLSLRYVERPVLARASRGRSLSPGPVPAAAA